MNDGKAFAVANGTLSARFTAPRIERTIPAADREAEIWIVPYERAIMVPVAEGGIRMISGRGDIAMGFFNQAGNIVRSDASNNPFLYLSELRGVYTLCIRKDMRQCTKKSLEARTDWPVSAEGFQVVTTNIIR